jgi:hypothetical protein
VFPIADGVSEHIRVSEDHDLAVLDLQQPSPAVCVGRRVVHVIGNVMCIHPWPTFPANRGIELDELLPGQVCGLEPSGRGTCDPLDKPQRCRQQRNRQEKQPSTCPRKKGDRQS